MIQKYPTALRPAGSVRCRQDDSGKGCPGPHARRVRLCIDIYRPDTKKKVPALLAVARHNKDMQSPETCEEAPAIGPQPAWAPFWFGAQEAGDTRYLVARGYAHVIGNIRGHAKSEDGPPSETDHYDLIEWIAGQSWCDGNIGMIGPSDFARRQIEAAKQQPPHLKAIFPYSPAPRTGFGTFIPEESSVRSSISLTRSKSSMS